MSETTCGEDAVKLVRMNEGSEGSIGSRIASRMAAHQPEPLEPVDIAAATRASTYTVRRWLDDVSKPSAENLPPLARVLGVPIYWLLTGHFETMADWLDESWIEESDPTRASEAQSKAKQFTFDHWLEARRLEGMSDGEIRDLLVADAKRLGLLAAEPTAEPAAPPAAALPSDEEIAEQLGRRPGGSAGGRGGARRDPQDHPRPRSSDEEDQP